MKAKAFAAMLVCALFMLPGPAIAEFFKYTDQNGVVRFTDNMGDVPQDQRSDLTRYSQPEDSLSPESQIEAVKNRANEIQKDNQAKAARQQLVNSVEKQLDNKARAVSKKINAYLAEENRLKEEEKNLNAEHETLQAEMEKFQEKKKRIRRRSSARAYDRDAKQLQAKIDAYVEKRRVFDEKIRRFVNMKKSLMK